MESTLWLLRASQPHLHLRALLADGLLRVSDVLLKSELLSDADTKKKINTNKPGSERDISKNGCSHCEFTVGDSPTHSEDPDQNQSNLLNDF